MNLYINIHGSRVKGSDSREGLIWPCSKYIRNLKEEKKPNNLTSLYSYMNLIGNYLQYYDFYETPYLIREIVGPAVKD